MEPSRRGFSVAGKAIEASITRRQDFAFETTLAGRGYLRLIDSLQHLGWRVELIYLALPSARMSRLRVMERVAHGGHDVPESDIERRFPRSLRNLLTEYSRRADRTRCFMNTGAESELVFEQQDGQRTIRHSVYYQHILHEAGL